MLSRGSPNVVRDVEAGGHSTSEYARAVRPGSQSPSLAGSINRTSESESEGSVVNGTPQTGLPSRRSNPRPPSRSTTDAVDFAAPGDKPSPDIIERVKTGLKQQEDSKPSPLEKVAKTLCSPFATKKAKKKDTGNVELDAENPGPWVVDHHLRGLILKIVSPPAEGFQQWINSQLKAVSGKSHQAERLDKEQKPEQTFRISFAEMQRMHLRKLQVSLVTHAVTMYGTREESENWEKDLAAYSELQYSPITQPVPKAPIDNL